ncbi:uncharacterized protein LOC135209290 [Macrobrachium nipponense]|uniref:uncharacterized protein LOC135209290 n=1 Tax=Macrobrachium nipponense TaxID=159736 RepID=UPI0030C7B497
MSTSNGRVTIPLSAYYMRTIITLVMKLTLAFLALVAALCVAEPGGGYGHDNAIYINHAHYKSHGYGHGGYGGHKSFGGSGHSFSNFNLKSHGGYSFGGPGNSGLHGVHGHGGYGH